MALQIDIIVPVQYVSYYNILCGVYFNQNIRV